MSSGGAHQGLQRQLASVHLLLSSDRAVAEHDILLATSFDALASGDKTTHELREHLQVVWPGIPIPLASVEAALDAARVGGFLERTHLLGERTAWRLADGQREVEESEVWAQDVLDRSRRELRDEAHAVLGPVGDQELGLWLDLLLETLRDGVKHSFEVLQANVTIVQSSLLIPDSFDLDLMLSRIERETHDETRRTFLQGMLVNAIDRTHPFGVEVVHNLCVGYVLLSYMQRRDVEAAVGSTGTVRGELALLDTPTLLRMVGPPTRSQPILEIVAMAIEVGFEIGIQPETVEELEHLLDGRERNEVRVIERQLADGADPAALRDLITDDVLAPWLDAQIQGPYGTWNEFRQNVTALISTLRAMGCGLLEPVAPTDGLRPQFAVALADVLSDRGRRPRNEPVLQHDAALLVRAYEARRMNPPTAQKVWPGGVVVTSDRSLNDAYERVVSDRATFPVAITFSQFMGIVTGCSSAAAAEKVALIASDQMSHDTLFSLTARFPLEAVLSLADNVTSVDPISRAEARMLQLDLAFEIRQRSGILEPGSEEQVRLVSEVLDRRHKRLSEALRAQRKFSEVDRLRSSTSAQVAAARAAEAERQQQRITDRLVSAVSENEEIRTTAQDAARRSQRMIPVSVTTTVLVMLAAAALLIHQYVGALGFVLSAVASLYVGREWAESRRPIWMYLGALFLSALGIIDLLK